MQNLSTANHGFEFIRSQEINNSNFRSLQWIVIGFLTGGAVILSEKPKSGKNILALDITLAVSKLLRAMTRQAILRNLTGRGDLTASSKDFNTDND